MVIRVQVSGGPPKSASGCFAYSCQTDTVALGLLTACGVAHDG